MQRTIPTEPPFQNPGSATACIEIWSVRLYRNVESVPVQNCGVRLAEAVQQAHHRLSKAPPEVTHKIHMYRTSVMGKRSLLHNEERQQLQIMRTSPHITKWLVLWCKRWQGENNVHSVQIQKHDVMINFMRKEQPLISLVQGLGQDTLGLNCFQKHFQECFCDVMQVVQYLILLLQCIYSVFTVVLCCH